MLDLMRGNEAAVKGLSTQCRNLLLEASMRLKILDPEHGEKELINLVAAVLAKLSQPLRKPQTLNPRP
jgi:hypothetical protein